MSDWKVGGFDHSPQRHIGFSWGRSVFGGVRYFQLRFYKWTLEIAEQEEEEDPIADQFES